jgi:acyl-CoA thioester hydrolase
MAAYRYVYTDRVQFSDTDMAGIVHFSNFFRFMERAEHAFFRSIDLSIWEGAGEIVPEERVGWPRVHASCDYHAPLFFQEEFEMELLVEEIRNKAIRYLIRCWNTQGTLIAEGRMAAACVRKDRSTGQMKAIPIPDRIRAQIGVAPEEKLRRPPPLHS